MIFFLYAVDLLQDQDNNDKKRDLHFRLITAPLKSFTAKESLKVISDAMESFGGAGYLEDTGIAKYLRD